MTDCVEIEIAPDVFPLLRRRDREAINAIKRKALWRFMSHKLDDPAISSRLNHVPINDQGIPKGTITCMKP